WENLNRTAADILAPRLNPPHAVKALQSSLMFRDRTVSAYLLFLILQLKSFESFSCIVSESACFSWELIVMLALVQSGVRTTSRRFFQSREGSVAMLFALALIPLMIAAGAALDYSRANSFKAVLQATLDSALLAGAKDGSSNWTQVALNVFQSNLAAKSSA